MSLLEQIKKKTDDESPKNVVKKISDTTCTKIRDQLRFLKISYSDFLPVIRRRGCSSINDLDEQDACEISEKLSEKILEINAREAALAVSTPTVLSTSPATSQATEYIPPSGTLIVAYEQPACPHCLCTWLVESYGLNSLIRCWSCRRTTNRAMTSAEASDAKARGLADTPTAAGPS